MTTFEKAAKAMFEMVRARAKQNGLIFGPETWWEELPDWVQKEYIDQVRVTVEVIRNPTPEMCIAGGIAIAESEKTAETQVDNANECWRRMVGVILDESA